ncbi:MAG: hypothetical protein MJZ04_09215 [Bacteroidales bacterium]|nr:hypothetical protein [Bacteroidales bacterium]
MAYQIKLDLPEGWKKIFEIIEDEDGNVTSHLEGLTSRENEYIDLYVGTLPPDTTAEDEAVFNYADMIGWDESEPIGEDNSPLTVTKFQKKKAYGFEGLVEDGILRVMCVEVQPETLLVMNVCAPDETAVAKMVRYIEVNMSIS